LPLSIEIPHPALEPLFPSWRSLTLPAHTALLGKSYGYDGERDETVSLYDSPHWLVAGTTGSGKSRLLELLIYSLALNTSPADLQFYFVDLKNEDLVQFANLPHCAGMALSLAEASEIVAKVWQAKEARVRMGRNNYQRAVLVIDELAELSHEKEIMSWLASILAIGRSKNINVIAATQKPTAKVVGSVAKANFVTRLVGKVLGASDAEVAAGMPGTGAHLLPGRGSFLNVRGDQQQRFQAYLLDDDAEFERLRAEQEGVRLADVRQVSRDRWVAQLPLVLPKETAVAP
jgi:DNA segregation ATPase FtsK/SpoIIIE-like protein